ncbi:L-lactate permease [Cryobacterium breve]|uniref:L-lactate permease n=1 Tax=Cryobacterium breve TaxID=1259258 RepID=UPI003BB174A4
MPLILLVVLLGVFRVKAHTAALASLFLSVVLAVVGWQMPVGQALSATAAGIFYGLFPILWILVNALRIYELTVATPWFEVLGRTIRSTWLWPASWRRTSSTRVWRPARSTACARPPARSTSARAPC